MSSYRQDSTSRKYESIANRPTLDRVCFTLDHIHSGEHGLSSTYEVVKFLVDRKIPVTVFMQATSPSNDYELDRNNARLIHNLSPNLVTLGIHPLSSGNSAQKQKQTYDVIKEIIRDVTGENPKTLSYHGAGAGPESHISYPGIKYCRGISSAWAVGADDPNNTPVIVLNTVTRAINYAKERNAADLSATVFIHTQELTRGSAKKRIFDTFVKEVLSRRIQAVSYFDAMEGDFNVGHRQPLPTTTPAPSPRPTPRPAPPAPSPSGRKASLRLSASTKQGRRPVAANFYIQKTNGHNVDSSVSTTTEQFKIPEGTYKVTAKRGRESISETITVSATKGVHHIFLMEG